MVHPSRSLSSSLEQPGAAVKKTYRAQNIWKNYSGATALTLSHFLNAFENPESQCKCFLSSKNRYFQNQILTSAQLSTYSTSPCLLQDKTDTIACAPSNPDMLRLF